MIKRIKITNEVKSGVHVRHNQNLCVLRRPYIKYFANVSEENEFYAGIFLVMQKIQISRTVIVLKVTKKNPCKYEFQHSLNQLNSFLAKVPILYPLKTQENSWFFSIFRRYEIGTLARNELKYINTFRKVSLTVFISLLRARTLSAKTAYVLPSLVLNSNMGEYGPQPPPVVLSLTFTSYLVK